MSDLVEDLRRQLARKNTDQDNVGSLGPASPVEGTALEAEERALGFKLPEVLKRIYREIGNGGFGPGYGLIGVKGGWPDGDAQSIPASTVLRHKTPFGSSIPICMTRSRRGVTRSSTNLHR